MCVIRSSVVISGASLRRGISINQHERSQRELEQSRESARTQTWFEPARSRCCPRCQSCNTGSLNASRFATALASNSSADLFGQGTRTLPQRHYCSCRVDRVTVRQSTWGNPLRNASQGGGVFISFRAGDEESALLADSEARNANQFPVRVRPRTGTQQPAENQKRKVIK
jgi:hypothetical protein